MTRTEKIQFIKDHLDLNCEELAKAMCCSKTNAWTLAIENNLKYKGVKRACGRQKTKEREPKVKKGFFDLKAYSKLAMY